jgi:hypothetical protein
MGYARSRRSDPEDPVEGVAGYGLYVAKQMLPGRLFETIDELKETFRRFVTGER